MMGGKGTESVLTHYNMKKNVAKKLNSVKKIFGFKHLVFIQYILIVFLSPSTSPRSSVPTQTPTTTKN